MLLKGYYIDAVPVCRQGCVAIYAYRCFIHAKNPHIRG